MAKKKKKITKEEGLLAKKRAGIILKGLKPHSPSFFDYLGRRIKEIGEKAKRKIKESEKELRDHTEEKREQINQAIERGSKKVKEEIRKREKNGRKKVNKSEEKLKQCVQDVIKGASDRVNNGKKAIPKIIGSLLNRAKGVFGGIGSVLKLAVTWFLSGFADLFKFDATKMVDFMGEFSKLMEKERIKKIEARIGG